MEPNNVESGMDKKRLAITVIVLAVVVVAVVLAVKSRPETAMVSQNLPQRQPCQPEAKENAGSCSLGKISVDAALPTAAMEQVLGRLGLSILESNKPIVNASVSVKKLDKKNSNEQWQSLLTDPIVAFVNVQSTLYDDGIFPNAVITFKEQVTDEQINGYLQKKGLTSKVYESVLNDKLTRTIFVVKVPDGTEYDWEAKLKTASSAINTVSPYYKAFERPGLPGDRR